MTQENPVEYRHHSKKSLIVQKEVGRGRDSLTFSDGVKNSLREDCDILVIGEIRDKVTMEAAIEMNNTKAFNMIVLGGLLKLRPIVTLENVIKGLKKTLPERHHHLIPMNEEAIKKGMELIREV